MRRYVYPLDLNTIENEEYDVIIVGEGIAGLYASLHLNSKFKVALMSKGSEEESSSYLSQGGIATVLNPDDSEQKHFEDTITAGAGLCDVDAVRFLVNQGPTEIDQLLIWNVGFDTKENGQLQTTMEGGHSKRRIIHCGGDETGKEIVDRLKEIVADASNITEINNAYLVDIYTENDKTAGVIASKGGKFTLLKAQYVIICTGGIGALYQFSTNPDIATGDGIAASMRAGAKTDMMEFVQFHPTALYSEDDTNRNFLISEAVRGEGAVLRNEQGEAFMQKRSPLADLAPRDIVAREIKREMLKSDKPYVHLDVTMRSQEFLMNRFPNIYKYCEDQGTDISKEWIKVCPVQHYFMGGITTDLNGRTNIQGLYACGEVASTGVHGANRLASNSLLECVVFSRKCAEDINDLFKPNETKSVPKKIDAPHIQSDLFDLKAIKKEVQSIMDMAGGIIRTEKNMVEGLQKLDAIIEKLNQSSDKNLLYLEVLNMATVGQNIIQSALNRKENVGAHYRED